jgi:shikimate dehydrogenase
MKRAGIIGWPVSHSLSPILHGYWLKEYGIDGDYQRLPARPEEFEAAVARLREEGFAGVNVTVPHKEAAFKLAAARDKASDVCRATNLLLFAGGKVEGRNTDHVGLKLSLEENLTKDALEQKTVVLLGAGGAARAALLALDELGVAQIHILNRHQARADALAHDMALSITAKLVPGPMVAWTSVAPNAGLVINSTSAGMTGHDSLDLDLSPLSREAAVCDIVYSPLVTDLLKNAAVRGHQTIDGLGMLMHQAAPSFEAFFGIRPEVTPALRAVLEQALT